MKKIYLYPIWLRFWHWLNALLFIVLIVSGLSLHFSDPNSAFINFRWAMVSHNISGIFLSFNYALFFVLSLLTGNIKHYIPKIKGFVKRMLLQARYYLLGIFINEPHPFNTSKENKFNPMQQVAYLGVMFLLMPAIVISGWLLMFPETAPNQIFGMGGVWPMALFHSVVGFFLSLFLVGHLYLATTGSTVGELFKSMITGWHLEHEEEHNTQPTGVPIAPGDKTKKRSKFFPIIFYNPATLSGALITIISFILVVFLIILEFFIGENSPYLGIITFVVTPTFLIFGLLLIALGAIKENRRLLQMADTTKRLPVIDLNNPKHQIATIVFTLGTIIIVALSVFGTFKAYEYTDSDAFCGKVCHEVMEPEYTAYLDSPHSRVGCVKCHINPEADWKEKAKISGIYQIYSVMFNKYNRPITTPIQNLRPNQNTCEQCHLPKHFYSETKKDYDIFTNDENNSEYKHSLLIKVGGGSPEFGNNSGIHWSMNLANEITYLPLDDKRNIIPWVKSRSTITGKEVVYKDTSVKFSTDLLKPANMRRMDCIDCHNRQSHIFSQPNSTINKYIAANMIDRTLPYIKSIGVQTLDNFVRSRETSYDDIKSYIWNFYKTNYPEIAISKKDAINRTISQLNKIYLRNYFPNMNVNWKDFQSNIGHMQSPGCYRCHDGKHVSNDGKVISQDCNICHLITYQKTPFGSAQESSSGLEFVHPGGVDKIADTKNCVQCHGATPKPKGKIVSTSNSK